MKLIKLSPKFQITIPRRYRRLLTTDWLSIEANGRVLTLRPVDIKESQTEEEFLQELSKIINGGRD